MDVTPTAGPDSNAPDEAGQVKKAWIPPRLTVHGSIPTLTFGSPLSKTPP